MLLLVVVALWLPIIPTPRRECTPKREHEEQKGGCQAIFTREVTLDCVPSGNTAIEGARKELFFQSDRVHRTEHFCH